MAQGRDSDPGLGPPGFPTTRWSILQGDRNHPTPQFKAAFETLASTYWRPICAYIRSCGPGSSDEAKDLAQDFLVWMMETGFIGKADRGRGRFRTFIKHALSRFLIDRLRRNNAWKRGGRSRILALRSVSEGEAATYGTIARTLGIAPSAVSNHLMHARRRFRQILKTLVSDTVLSRDDL